MKKKLSTDEMVKRLLAGDRRSAARLITLVENEMDDHHKVMSLVYPHTGQAMILGITGAGGAGKSTLTAYLIGKFREQEQKVGGAVDMHLTIIGLRLVHELNL